MSEEQNSIENSVETAQAEVEGTISQEQSTDTAQEQVAPEVMMQADYTRKSQTLAEERAAFQAEQQAFYSQRDQGYTQAQPQYNQGYTQQSPQDMTAQQLVDQFGTEGAEAIKALFGQSEQQINQMKFQAAYAAEANAGRQKYGAENWDKFNYQDPQTGEMKNKVMDMRLMQNPITGQSLNIDQAYALANPDAQAQATQKATDAAYQEINKKHQNTPAVSSGVAPQSSGTGHATSVESAFDQAFNE